MLNKMGVAPAFWEQMSHSGSLSPQEHRVHLRLGAEGSTFSMGLAGFSQ